MLQLSLMLTSTMITIIFTQMSHPLAMTLIILIQTMLMCIISGMISQSFWFSYILFLVFLGGMLVLFIYITSLASNEMYSIPTKTILSITILLATLTFISLMMDPTLWSFMTTNTDMINMKNPSYLSYSETTMSLTKLYNKPTDLITLMLVMYLFLTLIAIVKITNIFQGPLRQKN